MPAKYYQCDECDYATDSFAEITNHADDTMHPYRVAKKEATHAEG